MFSGISGMKGFAKSLSGEADRILREHRESREKAAKPCTLKSSNGEHHWQYHRGWLTERLYKECNCGARDEMGKA